MKEGRIFPDDGDRLMSIDETAARLKTSPAVVRRLLEARAIVPVRNGRRQFIRKFALNNFLAQIEGRDILEIIGGKGETA